MLMIGSIDECLDRIKAINENNRLRIEQLENENQYLREEYNKAVKEAAEFEAADKKRKEAIDARNEADSIVFQTEKALEEAGDKVDPTEKAAVEADLKDLKDLVEATKDQDMTDAQVEDLKAKKDKLMTSAQNLFTKMYEAAAQAQQGAQGAADAGANQGAANDDVVDGDYKEV